jgi:hypothetical protein
MFFPSEDYSFGFCTDSPHVGSGSSYQQLVHGEGRLPTNWQLPWRVLSVTRFHRWEVGDPGGGRAGGGRDAKRDPKVWDQAKVNTSPLAFSVWGVLPQSTQTHRLNPAFCLSGAQTKPALWSPSSALSRHGNHWIHWTMVASQVCERLSSSPLFLSIGRRWLNVVYMFSFLSWHIYTLVLFCFVLLSGGGMWVGGDGVAGTSFY